MVHEMNGETITRASDNFSDHLLFVSVQIFIILGLLVKADSPACEKV